MKSARKLQHFATSIRFTTDMQIILASKSPRRKDILNNLGVDFICEVTNADETLTGKYTPQEAVCELSLRKAHACAQNHTGEDVLIIAADTVVVHSGRIIGKPKDEKDAFEILGLLNNSTHQVYTGFTVIFRGKQICDYETSSVTFCNVPQSEIAAYIATGEPFDKAGGYGIQGKACPFVKSICGDYFNVVGLPASKICNSIRDIFGIDIVFHTDN